MLFRFSLSLSRSLSLSVNSIAIDMRPGRYKNGDHVDGGVCARLAVMV